MRRFSTLAIVAAVLMGLVAPPVLSSEMLPLRPDLQTVQPKDFSIETYRGERRLRFDNEVLNAGAGVLELYTTSTKCTTGKGASGRIAMQRLYSDDGSGIFERETDTASTSQPAGCMTFHQAHRHWHFDDFALYEVFQLDAGVRGAQAAVSTKSTFCIIDIHRRTDLTGELAGSPTEKYYRSCSRSSVQGLSIGWSDEYTSTLSDQYVVITALAAGTYCFVSTADPRGVLAETNDANNSASVPIELLSDGTVLWGSGSC